jgi:hypothetical protein
MAIISVTRLRVRSIFYIIPFIWNVFLSTRQLKRATGFLGGRLHRDVNFAFWTMTAWESEKDMLNYRGSGSHRQVMPKLLKWCDEASVVRWETEEVQLPDWKGAFQLMTEKGRLSKVDHPSPAHLAKEIEEPKISDQFDQIIRPL